MKYGECICPLSWSLQCNFVRDGKCSERGIFLGILFHHDGMYARKRSLPLCMYSVLQTISLILCSLRVLQDCNEANKTAAKISGCLLLYSLQNGLRNPPAYIYQGISLPIGWILASTWRSIKTPFARAL